jgi:hypothetical protein
MECWSDELIERAAVRLADAGIAPGIAPGAAVASDLIMLLEHTRTCFGCRSRLHSLFDTEILSRARGRAPTVLPLRPVERPPAAAEFPAPSEWAEPYALAAQTPEVVVGVNPNARLTPVLTLTTGDDRFVVRIFPNTPGPGATAVLYPAQLGATLRIDGTSFSFTDQGTVLLPRFPAADVSLVLH